MQDTNDTLEQFIDWERLPAEVLGLVYSHLFHSPTEYDTIPSLKDVYRQWAVLQLVCSSWRQVLEEYNPVLTAVIYSVPEEHFSAVSTWVLERKFTNLRIGTAKSVAPCASGSASTNSIDSEFAQHLHITPSNTEGNVDTFRILSALGDLSALPVDTWPFALADLGLPVVTGNIVGLLQQPLSSILLLSNLQTLELSHPDLWTANKRFNAAVLAQLPNLTTLTLKGYRDYSLTALPSSLKQLHLEYGESFNPDVLSSFGINMVELPKECLLDSLTITKNGVLGIEMDNIWDNVQHLSIKAQFVLVGVPVTDTELVTDFKRPYAEGFYVPPHLHSDWNAIESSNAAADKTASLWLVGLAKCSQLTRATFTGPAATSVKLVPCTSTGTVAWVHAVAHQAPHFLFGMSGAELVDRQIDLRAKGTLRSPLDAAPTSTTGNEAVVHRLVHVQMTEEAANSDFDIVIE